MTMDESSHISATYLMYNTALLCSQAYTHTHTQCHMQEYHTTLIKTAFNFISHLSELVCTLIESLP